MDDVLDEIVNAAIEKKRIQEKEIENMKENSRIQSLVGAMLIGVPIVLSPEETEKISINAKLPPLADGHIWEPGLNLPAGTIVIYNDFSYQVIQGHISQSGWAPDQVPALFKQIYGEYTEWEQPLGSHDAYMIGDKVSYQDSKWESIVDSNIWAPDVYGWVQI